MATNKHKWIMFTRAIRCFILYYIGTSNSIRPSTLPPFSFSDGPKTFCINLKVVTLRWEFNSRERECERGTNSLLSSMWPLALRYIHILIFHNVFSLSFILIFVSIFQIASSCSCNYSWFVSDECTISSGVWRWHNNSVEKNVSRR